MKHSTIYSNYFVSYYHKQMISKKGLMKRTIMDRSEVLSLLSLIWKTVSEHYLENDGGVYIDNIGYLCHMIVPHQKFGISRITNDVIRMGTNGYKYNHTVLDFSSYKRYYHLVISDYLKKKSKNKMNKGKRYRFLYNEVQAKKHIFKDFQIKNVCDLKYKRLP